MDNGTIKVGSDPSKMPRKPQKEKLLQASPKRMAVAQKISVGAALDAALSELDASTRATSFLHS